MNRDLRFYFLVIGLPAFLLALGGLRLLYVESRRTYALGRDALQTKATLAALILSVPVFSWPLVKMLEKVRTMPTLACLTMDVTLIISAVVGNLVI